MSTRLSGKIALITGGSSGIGLATAQRFTKEGARVIIVGRERDSVDAAVATVGSMAYGIICDIKDASALEKAFHEISERFGRLDVVFANAGVVNIAPLAHATVEQYDNVFDTCVKGTIFTVQYALPHMTHGGSIILNGAAIASQGIQGLGLNAAAKSAVRSLGRTLAAELAERDIRVNVVSPGTIMTPLLQKSGMSEDAITTMNSDSSPIPLRRIGHADEMAAAILFLASDESSYITGVELPVDGGVSQV